LRGQELENLGRGGPEILADAEKGAGENIGNKQMGQFLREAGALSGQVSIDRIQPAL
jgi:hypothetical protein